MKNALALKLTLAVPLVLALGLLYTPAAQADGTKVIVSTTILKRATLEVLNQPGALVITAADLARGYVDAPASAQVAIRSNTAGGYLLEFASQGDFMRQILVRGLSSDVQLSPAGGLVAQSGAAGGVTRTTVALGFRFLLSESAQQGSYPWPMRVSIAPL